jgi:pimeloyl-ACP methyl ester carboxylesterase
MGSSGHNLGRRDLTRLSPPGFGAAIPPGFGCTVSEYRDWLIEQLEAFDEPVDLIGHDWGGGHVVNVAMTRPDLLRSWATDAIGRIGRPVADELAAGQDEEMGRALYRSTALPLYRSAAQPVMAEIGRDLASATQRPGLCFLVVDDQTVGSDAMRRRAAARAGAQVEALDGVGHCWLVQTPARGAQALNDFWALVSPLSVRG